MYKSNKWLIASLSMVLALFMMLVLSVVSMSTVHAAEKSKVKIALVLPDLVFAQSQVVKEKMEVAKEELSSEEQRIKTEFAKFSKLAKEYNESKALLSKKELAEKEATLKQLQADLQAAERELKTFAAKQRNEILKEVEPKFRAAVEEIASEGDYDLVLNAQAVLWARDEISTNITSNVVEKLNKK